MLVFKNKRDLWAFTILIEVCMDCVYLLTKFKNDEEFESVAFKTRDRAMKYIAEKEPSFRAYAKDSKEDVEFWSNKDNHGLLLEKINLVI